MIIKGIVQKEIELKTILTTMRHYLLALESKPYLSADDRMKALEDVKVLIPFAFRCLVYIKTTEISTTLK